MTIASERRGTVTIITMNDGAMNSFDATFLADLTKHIHAALADPDVRGVVLAGAGKAFSAGANVAEFQRAIEAGNAPDFILEATDLLHPLMQAFRRTDKAVVAAVNGVAAGGGLGLALAADARIGSEHARFAAGYFGLGVSPDGGSTWLLPRLMGEARTRQFFFNNEVMGAEEALRVGLLDHVVPAAELVDRAVAQAEAWGAWARHSRESTKRLLESQAYSDFQTQLDAERAAIAAAGGTRDFAEGVQAFHAKRRPQFR